MSSRRSFLLGVGTVTLSQLLSACGDDDALLRIALLQNTLPSQLAQEFKKKVDQGVVFKPLEQIKDAYELLNLKPSTPNKFQIPFLSSTPPLPTDIITLGDYFLAEAIEKKLIQPLQTQQIASWHNLPPRFQTLVKRDPGGAIWGAPYRWGMTAIAYDAQKLQSAGIKPPEDWADLWREEYRGHLSLLDQRREVIGLTLKKLGYSYNTEDLNKVPELKNTLAQLHRNVKFYSSSYYLQALIFSDTWLAVGWSNELISLQNSYPQIKVVIPPSGTSLWADLWVRTSQSKGSATLIDKWIDFCWQAKAVNQISLFTDATSPMIFTLPKADLSPDLHHNPIFNLAPDIFAKSEFLAPLSPSGLKLYESFWREMRKTT